MGRIGTGETKASPPPLPAAPLLPQDCAHPVRSGDRPPGSPRRPPAFARHLERSLEAHAWEELLAAAEERHYRIQVTEHGMAEPQYLAELFGLHRVGNDIGEGGAITWSDLERIREVRLQAVTPEDGRQTLTGEVLLPGGRTLELRAWIVEREGGFRLTGGVG